MKQFLIIQKTSPLRDYIELYIKAYSDVTIVAVESITDAITKLQSGVQFDCVFIGSGLIVDAEAKELTGSVQSYVTSHPACKVIGTNKGLSTQDWVIYVPSMAPPVKIFETIRQGLGLPDNVTATEFAGIPISCLNYCQEAPCDLYFRIGANPEEATYVKRFNEKEALDSADVARYVAKNVRYIYVSASKVQEISDLISSKILHKVTAAEGVGQMEIATDALEYASYALNSMGLKSNSLQKVQQVISVILNTVVNTEKDKKKAKTLQSILDAKEDFYHKHVSLTAMLAISILEELKWDNTAEYRSTLTYAAFFHNFFINEERDITCIDEDALASIEPQERKEKIQNHAKLAVEFIKDIKGIPYEVQAIIMEQHGSHSGVGFPVGKNNSSQLSTLFMISNEFALRYLINFEKNSAENVQALLKRSLELYGKNSLKILEALQNCISGHLAA